MSALDAQTQQQGEPTAAQQAQGDKPSAKMADDGCQTPATNLAPGGLFVRRAPRGKKFSETRPKCPTSSRGNLFVISFGGPLSHSRQAR
jgi:hypothetical protein